MGGTTARVRSICGLLDHQGHTEFFPGPIVLPRQRELLDRYIQQRCTPREVIPTILPVSARGPFLWNRRWGRRFYASPMRRSQRRIEESFGRPSRHAVHDVLALASRAAEPLRAGLTPAAASVAVGPLAEVLHASALGLSDTVSVLAYTGECALHETAVIAASISVLAGRGTNVEASRCGRVECAITAVVVAPLIVEGSIVGTLQAFVDEAELSFVRAVEELARWVANQVELGELDRARVSAAGAQLRTLRAQISPHFLFNALNTIASFVRTDPERARELLMEFADFARYTFSSTDQFATFADELRAIDTYVSIERARFGDRLNVSLRVAPEVLGVPVPFLVLQPLVENALQHGLYRKEGGGTLTVRAFDAGTEAHIVIEDDGVGMDPELLAERLAGHGTAASDRRGFGMASVDERLRTTFGSEYGIVVETGIGLGTKVTIRVPKFRAHQIASGASSDLVGAVDGSTRSIVAGADVTHGAQSGNSMSNGTSGLFFS
jgi:two-component system, LytTR family, sensor kinase